MNNQKKLKTKIREIFLKKKISKLVFKTIQNTRVVVSENDVTILFSKLNSSQKDYEKFLTLSL